MQSRWACAAAALLASSASSACGGRWQTYTCVKFSKGSQRMQLWWACAAAALLASSASSACDARGRHTHATSPVTAASECSCGGHVLLLHCWLAPPQVPAVEGGRHTRATSLVKAASRCSHGGHVLLLHCWLALPQAPRVEVADIHVQRTCNKLVKQPANTVIMGLPRSTQHTCKKACIPTHYSIHSRLAATPAVCTCDMHESLAKQSCYSSFADL
jgi:hypothetical protein